MFAGNAHKLRQPSAGADKHGIVAFFFHQFVDGDGASHDYVGFKLHAHGAHVIDLLTDDPLWQAEFWNAIHEHATDLVQCLENVHLVPLLHQIPRRRQAGGAAAHDGNFLSRRRRLGQVADVEVALFIVGDEALQVSDAQRLNLLAHQTAAFAVIFLRTDAAGDGGQHVIFADLGRRAHEVAGDDELHELFHFDAHRTVDHAYRLGALEATRRFLPRQFFGIAPVHFGPNARTPDG